MDIGFDGEFDNGSELCTNIGDMPLARRDIALFLHPEEIWPRHRLRVHGPLTYHRSHELAQRENEHGDLLLEAQAQQLAKITAVRVPRPRHPPFNHTQQQPGETRRIFPEFHR